MFINKEELRTYAIVLPKNASSCLAYAAALLAEYVEKVAGVKLSVAEEYGRAEKFFSLGETAAYQNKARKAELSRLKNDDGFYIDGDNGNLYIVGVTDRGVLYGVVEYLERFLHIRFFTADCEAVPTATELPLPQNFYYYPPLRMRTYLVGDVYDDTRAPNYITPKIDQLVKTHTRDVFTTIDEKHGGAIELYGRNISHNFHFYVPYERYGKTHPEFYREIAVNGEKTYTIDITNGLRDDGTIDETQEESVVRIVIEEMKKDVLAYPDVKVFLLTQEDGEEYFDDENNRAQEKKYKRSGMLIRFCNAVVRALNEWSKRELNGRVIKLATFAYSYAQYAPVKKENGKILPLDKTVVADDNLIIQLALFSNGVYGYFDERQDERVKNALKEWKTIGKQFWFWAYDIDFSNYLSYFDSFAVVQENVRGFIDYGIDYLCINGPYDTEYSWQANLRGYLYHRLMWNPDLDVAALQEDYIRCYYGVAAEHFKRFLSIYHNNYKALEAAGAPVYAVTWGSHTYAKNNPLAMLTEAVAAIEDGERAVEKEAALSAAEKERYLKRLLCVKATPLNLLYLNHKEYYPESGEEERLQAKERFVQCAKAAGIDLARERMLLQAYVDFVESDDYKIRPMCSK